MPARVICDPTYIGKPIYDFRDGDIVALTHMLEYVPDPWYFSDCGHFLREGTVGKMVNIFSWSWSKIDCGKGTGPIAVPMGEFWIPRDVLRPANLIEATLWESNAEKDDFA